MIIISGAGIKREQLPFHDTINYAIEDDLSHLNVKLKTAARASSCIAIYINTRLQNEISYPDAIQSKLFFFKDDRELMGYLNKSSANAPSKTAPVVPVRQPEPEVNYTFEQPKVATPAVDMSTLVQQTIQPETPLINIVEFHLEEVSVEEDNDNSVLTLPHILDDRSHSQDELLKREKEIEQQSRTIIALQNELDESYIMQEQQIKDLRITYDNRLSESISRSKQLEKQVKDMEIPQDIRKFLKYASYLSSPRAKLQEGFYKDEMSRYNKTNSQVHIFANAGGTGVDMSGQYILNLLKGKESVVLIDFSNDMYLRHRLKAPPSLTSLKLDEPDVSVEKNAFKVGVSHYVPTSMFHDIALLGMDWIEILNKVNTFAKGRRVIFMFNSISSFAVKHTFSRLCTIGQGFVLAESKPSVLATLIVDLKFFPPQSLTVIVFKYIKEVQEILQMFTNNFAVKAFGNITDWSTVWSEPKK